MRASDWAATTACCMTPMMTVTMTVRIGLAAESASRFNDDHHHGISLKFSLSIVPLWLPMMVQVTLTETVIIPLPYY